ncbi:MAG TPA: hypothetical protein VN920_02265 [Pyrinomonadaceae bacterium]|nr:hypothetical protein [Pyrinomonadaceae bacterium]
MIGKAVTLSEAIARSDRGPLPKLKEMVKNFKIEQVTDEISGALDKMSDEIVRSSDESRAQRKKHQREVEREMPWWHFREKKTPERRREEHRVKGTVSFFTGIGLTIFLYNLVGALALKLPPEVLAKIPFEVEPVVRVLWTVGLIPTLSGLGHFAASFFIRSTPARSFNQGTDGSSLDRGTPFPQPVFASPAPQVQTGGASQVVPSSVTEHTTELLSSEAAQRNA